MAHIHSHCKWYITLLLLIFSQVQGIAADMLCFTAEADNSKFWYETNESYFTHDPDLWYSTDEGATWVELSVNDTVTLANAGDKVYLKGNNPDGFSASDDYNIENSISSFKMEGLIAASGNILSLIYGEDEPDPEAYLPSYCFSNLFEGCESLTQAPELPSTRLSYQCYAYMFMGCSNLREAPDLPARDMARWCYASMFQGCTSLTKTPEMDIFSEAKYCMSGMFSGCTSLVEAPITLPNAGYDGCYEEMFAGCTSLKQTPEFSISLSRYYANYAYAGMFAGCTSLDSLKIRISCYCLDLYPSSIDGIFSGVEKEGVLYTQCIDTTDTDYCLAQGEYYLSPSDLVQIVKPKNFHVVSSPIVIFLNPDKTELKRDTLLCGEIPDYGDEEPFLDDEHQFVKWDEEFTELTEPKYYYYTAEYEKIPDLSNCLRFTAKTDGSTFSIKHHEGNNPDIQYSINNGKKWKALGENDTVVLALGDIVYLRGNNPNGFSTDSSHYSTFGMTGSIAASGSVMSLVDKIGDTTVIPSIYCFTKLFQDCEALTDAPEMSALTLSESCYESMFSGCKNLTQAPTLPATNLEKKCYQSMFEGCAGLTATPDLPATRLASSCYNAMFRNCQNIKNGPAILPATELKARCYTNMFYGCGSLAKAPELPAMKLADYCYNGMFSHCSSLAEAPQLPATELKTSCYGNMFSACSNLSQAPELPCLSLADSCYHGMFNQCVSLEEAPELLATEFAPGCYKLMFDGCTNLSHIKVGVISLDNGIDATTDWVKDVNGPGLFDFPCGSTYDIHGASEVPTLFEIRGRSYAIDFPLQADDSFTWKGITYTESTAWNDTLQTVYGCDSIMRYQLEIKYTPIIVDRDLSTCDSFVFKGITYRENSVWNDTIRGNNRGDSITVYHLNLHKSVTVDTSLVADESFTWKGVTYTEDADWTDTLQTIYGCDSIVRYHLEVTHLGPPIIAVDREIFACDSFVFKGITYHEDSEWEDLTSGDWGDTLFSYHLNLHSSVTIDTSLVADESFTWKGITYTESTAWNDTLQTVFGCDSIVRYQLEIKHFGPSIIEEYIYISACDSFVFKGITYRENSVWNDTIRGNEGDSIIAYHLYLHRSMTTDTFIVAAEAFLWKGVIYTEDTVWTDTLLTVYGCENIVHFHLNVYHIGPPIIGCDRFISACDSFVFKGITYHEDSEWKDLASGVWDDTMFTYHLKLYNSVTKDTFIVADEAFLWKGIIYTENTDWDDTLQTVYGCDSIVRYHLEVTHLGPPFIVVDKEVFACDSFIFNGITYRENSEWSDTLKGKIRGDSITVYHLNLHKSVTVDTSLVAFESFTWKGVTYTEDADWTDTLQTIYGCDSIVRYHLEVTHLGPPIIAVDREVFACDSFVFKGITYHEDSEWEDLTSGSWGDTLFSYHLNIHRSVTVDTSFIADESFTWKGVTYTESTAWNDTLQTVFGCDSIVRYQLEIKHIEPAIIAVDKELSACDSFVFKGITYRENSEWNDTTRGNGGDSIIVYHLSIHRSVTVDTSFMADESFTWKGVTYTESTAWNDTLQTVYGCDSIVRYQLEIKHIEPAIIAVDKELSACDSFVFKGITYRENSEWNDTIRGNGEDSIIVYHLSIHRSVTVDTSFIADESFTWKGVTYTESAAWNDTLQTVFGCDSIVRYQLTVNKKREPLLLTTEDKMTLVLPGSSKEIGYELTGGEGTRYEVSHNGQSICSGDITNDSTFILDCPSDMKEGAYTATITIYDDKGEKADSEFEFNVMRPDDKGNSFYVKVWNDVIICRNSGGQFLSYQWYKNGQKCEGDTLQYFNELTLFNGEYMVYVSDKSGNSYFIEPCIFTPTPTSYSITAMPSVVQKGVKFIVKVTGVETDDLKKARIVVYNTNGVVREILNDVKEENTMSLSAGEYIIVLTVHDGNNANCKVLVK